MTARSLGAIGGFGVVLLVVGTFAPGVTPAVEAPVGEWTAYLADHRGAILLGAVLTVTALPLLLTALAGATPPSDSSMGTLAIGAWVFAFGFATLSSTLTAAVAWRGPDALDPSTVRFAVDVAHLALWGLSAAPTAVAVVATMAARSREAPVPRWLLGLAAVKVATCVVEVAGLGVTDGWNAGGYAGFSSGVALVAWLAGLVVLTARAERRAISGVATTVGSTHGQID